MAFIIPDKILETLICSFCQKYLSVKPIIVYPNRDVECGRCAENEKQQKRGAGVESLYGKIIEKCLFKCTNRFDGCRDLLTHSQVLDHEKVCLEKIHKCPICYEEMLSFMMIRHFHSNHKDAILDSSAFVFNLNNYLEMPGIYIYQEEDNLFFLYFSYSKSEKTIKLELVYTGSDKLASKTYHQFTVTNENKEFDINFNSKLLCTNEFFVVDASNMSHLIYVKFKVIYKNLKFFTIPENVHSSSINGSLEKPNQNQEVLTITETVDSSLSSINNLLEKPQPNQGKMRFIYANPLDCTREIVEFHSEYNPECFNCKENCILSTVELSAREYYYSPRHNNFLCFFCFEWLTHNNKIKQNRSYVTQLIPSTFKKRFCKWNCGQHFMFSTIVLHETFCEKSVYYYNCPHENCQIQNFASELKDHLKNDHNSEIHSAVLSVCKDYGVFFVLLKDQIIEVQLASRDGSYSMECKIVTNDNKIQLEWKPHMISFYNNKCTPLGIIPLNQKFIAKFVLMKNE
ncbi:uncharacterized protein [Diabrotica undecimpunctata]|uniref:uncharacterized protein n=1 Tax=Diabrotica undecimpunctata TaxID=50387 RepID=UPI003B633E69